MCIPVCIVHNILGGNIYQNYFGKLVVFYWNNRKFVLSILAPLISPHHFINNFGVLSRHFFSDVLGQVLWNTRQCQSEVQVLAFWKTKVLVLFWRWLTLTNLADIYSFSYINIHIFTSFNRIWWKQQLNPKKRLILI